MTKLVLSLFGLTTVLSVSAQSPKYMVGIEAGVGRRSLRGNTVINELHKSDFGLSSGAFFQYNLNEKYALRTNVAFERKGSKIKGFYTDAQGNDIGEVEYKNNFNYLTLPLLVRANFGEKPNFFINAGPYFGFLMQQLTVLRVPGRAKTKEDHTDRFKSLDFGVSAEAGVSLPLKTNLDLSLEMRNNLGLTNISKAPVANNGSIKTNTTNLLIGLAYKL